MCCPVDDFLELMLTVLPNNAPNSINKYLRFAQILTKEGFKYFPGDEDISFILYLPLVLQAAKQGRIFRESGCKGYLILTFDTRVCKMVLALLEKVITLQVGLTTVYI